MSLHPLAEAGVFQSDFRFDLAMRAFCDVVRIRLPLVRSEHLAAEAETLATTRESRSCAPEESAG